MRTSGGLSSERCSASSGRLFSARSESSCARRSAALLTKSTVGGSVIIQSRVNFSSVIVAQSSPGKSVARPRAQVQATRVAAAAKSFRLRKAKRPASDRASVATRASPPTAAGPIALLSLAHPKGAAFEVLAVQRLHCARCIRVRHFHKAETARPSRVAIRD